MNKLILLSSCIILLSVNTYGQTESKNKSGTIKLKIKITNLISVGWGDKYIGTIEHVIEGSKKEISGTIRFGITASKTFDFLKTGDIRIITFKKTNEINKNSYVPAMDCMVDKNNLIWAITKIEKIN